MAISSQARPKCLEGSETRLYVPTGLCVNLSVEYKGYENPRAPGNQKVQQMWQAKNFLREKSFAAVQAMPVGKIAAQVSENQSNGFSAMRGISQGKRFKYQAVSARMV